MQYPKYSSLFLLPLLALFFLFSCSDMNEDPSGVKTYEGYTLQWNDEFNNHIINSNNWNFETGDGTDYGLPVGWGNNEKQIYTNQPSNYRFETDQEGNSALVIIANEDSSGRYTSSKITTQNLQSFRFGKVEARIKLPLGKGIWPAFWMLGENVKEIKWPGCGEVDIVELVGSNPGTVYNTLHYTGGSNLHAESQGTYILDSGTFNDEYHVFTLDWTPESMTYYVDGHRVHQLNIEEDMKEFQRSFYLILNVAVGGNWPGSPDETTVFPQKMYVDYIRVYKKDGFVPPEAPALVIEEETVGTFLDARQAVNSRFDAFGRIKVNASGAGGTPGLSLSDTAIDTDHSIALQYPGSDWGGAFFELDEKKDLSAFSTGTLKFSMIKPESLVDAEIKLESKSTYATVNLKNYTPVDTKNGFIEYSIPLADFKGLDLAEMKIPFALWNPKDSAGSYSVAEVLVDNLYFQ